MKLARPLIALIVAALCAQFQPATAQEATVPVASFLGHVVDTQGIPPTDPDAPLFRAGTSPLVPLTRSNGDPITLDDFDNVTGQIHIQARPGGGTNVDLQIEGLFPGELYSVWAAYFQEPGFPQGARVGFGAVSEAGDGSDNFMVADANGTISLDLVQQEGPMTVQGSASSYAPISPFEDANGNLVPHAGYTVALAYHFNDPSSPPFLNPGPIEKWAVQAHTTFAAVPEPSSIVLGLFALAGVAVNRRRCLPSKEASRLNAASK